MDIPFKIDYKEVKNKMANDEIKFGIREGRGLGKEYPVAASQYFHNRGGHFVYFSAGNVTLCGSATARVAGWAEVPKQASGYNAWKSSATAEADSVFVITERDVVYEMPWDNSVGASLNASLVLSGVGINLEATTTGQTAYDQVQKARGGGKCAATPLKVIDINKENSTVFVKIMTNKMQG